MYSNRICIRGNRGSEKGGKNEEKLLVRFGVGSDFAGNDVYRLMRQESG